MLNLNYNEDPIQAVIYARVSSDGQDINNSVQRQIEECEKYAKEHNMTIVAIYVDEAMTGTSDKRPQFQKMVSDTADKDKPFTVILVWKFARFARHRVDSAFYKNRLKKRGVRTISIQQHTEDNASGRFMEHILEDVDQFYSDNLSEEVRSGQRKVAERGYWPGNRAPDGYKLKKVQEEGGNAFHNIFVIDPVRAPIIRRIFDETIAGQSRKDIRHGLDRDGIPPPEPKNKKDAKSEKWHDNTIGDILHNLKYAGFIVWGVNSKSGEPPVIAPGRHEPIVSPDEFELASKVMASNTPEASHPRRTGSVYMLSGLLLCRKGGESLGVRPSKNQTYAFYQCPIRRHHGVEVCNCPNLNIQKLEEKFLAALLDDILCPSNVEAAISQMAEELTGPYEEQNARLQAIENELLDVSQRRYRVMEAYEKGAYSVDDFNNRVAPLRKEEAKLKQHLAAATREVDHQTTVLAKPEEILEFTTQVADFIRYSSPKDRKQMLKRFIQCVWIEPGKATVVYRIPLPKDAKRPEANELVLALDEPVPPIARLTPPTRGFSRMPKERRARSLIVSAVSLLFRVATARRQRMPRTESAQDGRTRSCAPNPHPNGERTSSTPTAATSPSQRRRQRGAAGAQYVGRSGLININEDDACYTTCFWLDSNTSGNQSVSSSLNGNGSRHRQGFVAPNAKLDRLGARV